QLGDLFRFGLGRLSVIEQRSIEGACNGRLLDNEARVARVEAIQQSLDRSRLHDDVAKVLPRARFPGAELEHGIGQTAVDQVILKARLILEVGLRLALCDFVQRRLGNVEVPFLNKLRHLTVEERQQQRTDVRAVDIGVSHNDDLVITELRNIEAAVLAAADAGAERGDQRTDLLAGQHLVHAGALNVQNLAANRQDSLKLAVARLLGGAAGRVTLDDEQLRVRWVAVLTLG